MYSICECLCVRVCDRECVYAACVSLTPCQTDIHHLQSHHTSISCLSTHTLWLCHALHPTLLLLLSSLSMSISPPPSLPHRGFDQCTPTPSNVVPVQTKHNPFQSASRGRDCFRALLQLPVTPFVRVLFIHIFTYSFFASFFIPFQKCE